MNEPEQYLLDLLELEKPSLENFVVGKNVEAYEVLLGVAQGRGPKFVYLHGEKGVGLTHLLASLCPQEGRRVPIFDENIHLYTVDDVDELDRGYTADLLRLQNLVKSHSNAQLVCAGHLPLMQLTMPEEVKSRLGWGLTYAIHGLNEQARLEELTRLAYERGMKFTPEILNWIAVHLPRDMRTLTQFLELLDRESLKRARPITLSFVREVARNDASREQQNLDNQG